MVLSGIAYAETMTAGKAKKETKSEARARKAAYAEIHQAAIWVCSFQVLPITSSVFCLVNL